MAKASRSIAGMRFGKLIALSPAGRHYKTGQEQWNCSCECGGNIVVFKYSLQSGNTKSCGCLGGGRKKTADTDGHVEFRDEYFSWIGMRARCLNPKTPSFADYGGRGITICDRWSNSFDSFLEDMGRKPPGTSLDRIDVDKGYSPENCRWASPETQVRNRRNTIFLEFNGESYPASEWAERLGTNLVNIYQRLKAGYSHQETIQYYLDKKAAGKQSCPVRLSKPLQLKSDGSSVFYVGKNMKGAHVVQSLDKEYLEVSLEDLQNAPESIKRSFHVTKETETKKATTLHPKQKTAQATQDICHQEAQLQMGA